MLYGEIKKGKSLSGFLQQEVINLGERDKQTKTVIPTEERQSVKADAGFELVETIVEPIPDEYADITGVTASAEDVLNGKVFVDNQGNEVQGIAELKEDLDAELTAQDEALTSLESAVDKLPEPKKDMLQERVDIDGCYRIMYGYRGNNVDFIENLDTSRATTMKGMFYACTYIKSIPPLDMSSCTDTADMFNQCTSLTILPPLDTSRVTDMSNMFYYCKALSTIPPLDMIKATSVGGVVSSCTNLTNLTLKNIKKTLQIGSSTSWGHLLTDESIINTAKELWDLTGSSSQKLTLSTPSNARLDAIYVKLIEATADMIANDEYITNKKPCAVCESTDEGAMTLREYILSKNWTIA